MTQYDDLIKEHYRKEAEINTFKPTSTMSDERIRALETELIVQWVGEVVPSLKKTEPKIILGDMGCGNGYTLELLKKTYPKLQYVGLEYTDELRKLAEERFKKDQGVQIVRGDIRDADSLKNLSVDLLISQRVLINLLDPVDQAKALNNLADIVKPGGYLLFIEAFYSGLKIKNEARAEFGFPPISMAYHNLYLEDNFFDRHEQLGRISLEGISEHFLSTHYFVTRVLHPLALGNRSFHKNTHFVNFFSQALKQNIGNYSPLKCVLLKKKIKGGKRDVA